MGDFLSSLSFAGSFPFEKSERKSVSKSLLETLPLRENTASVRIFKPIEHWLVVNSQRIIPDVDRNDSFWALESTPSRQQSPFLSRHKIEAGEHP